MSAIRLVLVLLLLPFSAFAAALVDPPAVTVPTGVAPAAVVSAIKSAASKREWLVNDKGPGLIELQLLVRTHMVKVAVAYNATEVSIKYLDSSEMNYDANDGEPRIHSKYMNWTRNLALDIGLALNRAQNGG